MNQEFSGEVGQVAGRDVRSSHAQANVNIHFHNGAKSKRYISDRQRRVIGAKVFELEAKTRVEKLIVYRRLMTRFKFQSMDEMPRDLFERVMRYLDGWLRNGSADQPAPLFAQPKIGEQATAITQSVMLPKPQADVPAPEIVTTVPARPEPTSALHQKKHLPWLAAFIAVTITIVLTAVTRVVAQHSDVTAQNQAVNIPLRCEYGVNRYSLGSMVMQAGVLRQCASVDGVATWQKVDTTRR